MIGLILQLYDERDSYSFQEYNQYFQNQSHMLQSNKLAKKDLQQVP